MAGRGLCDNRLERALALAFRSLARRERTCEEVRGYLVDRDVDPSAAELAIRELTEQGYLDDLRFARLFVQDKRALAQWGADRIRRELLVRGIERELIEDALAQEDGDAADSELERAHAVLRRRFPDGATNRRDRERALGVLLRKGYGYEIASRALGENS